MKKLIIIFTLFITTNLYAQITYDTVLVSTNLCDFEIDTVCPYLDSINNSLWQLGETNKPFFDSLVSLMTDTVNPYVINSNEYVSFSIPIYGNVILLELTHKFQTDTLIDGCIIEASIDEKNTWLNVRQFDTVQYNRDFVAFDSENLYGFSDTLINSNIGFSGSSNGWIKTKIFWYLFYTLKTNVFSDTLFVRFRFISDSIQTNKAGWQLKNIALYNYIDNVKTFIENDNRIKLYPNPTTGKVNIQLSTTEPIEIILYTLQGQEIQRNTLNQNGQIDISHLSKGVYFYQLRTDSVTATGKIIKE